MEKNKNQIRLSPSAIQSFRACPRRYKLSYIDRIQTVEDKEVLRQGTNWHSLFEVAYDAPEGANLLDVITEHMNKVYEVCPDSIKIEDWEKEKYTLLYSFLAYCDHYREQQEEIASEIKFEFALRHPRLGHEITDCVITGRVDKLVKNGPRVSVKEYKTTGRQINAGSDYWRGLERQIQPRLYVYALLRMIEAGELDPLVVSEVEYDVFKKPDIRPKIPVKDNTEFNTTGFIYYGTAFDGEVPEMESEGMLDARITSTGATSSKLRKPVKKNTELVYDGFIYYGQPFDGDVPDIETGVMFGARLFADIQADPFKYFARRPIAILAKDIKSIEWELYNIYKLISYCKKNKFWDIDPYSCSQPFKCEYQSLCDQNIDPDVDKLPDTFKRGW